LLVDHVGGIVAGSNKKDLCVEEKVLACLEAAAVYDEEPDASFDNDMDVEQLAEPFLP